MFVSASCSSDPFRTILLDNFPLLFALAMPCQMVAYFASGCFRILYFLHCSPLHQIERACMRGQFLEFGSSKFQVGVGW